VTSANEIESILLDAFEDVALLISATAVNHLDDAVIWMMMRRLHRLRLRTLSRLPVVIGRSHSVPAAVMPVGAHPAVEQFLHLNRSVRMQSGVYAGKESTDAERLLDAELRECGGTNP
jgi:hypothetical protein